MKLTIRLEGIKHLQIVKTKLKGKVSYSINNLSATSPKKLINKLKQLSKIF